MDRKKKNRIVVSTPSKVNINFVKSKLGFYKLFEQHGIQMEHVPLFFKRLFNGLKDASKGATIYLQVKKYLEGKFTIGDIRNEMKKPKPIKKGFFFKGPRARIVKKR